MGTFNINEEDAEIIEAIKKEYKEAAHWLPFSAVEINEVFSDEEMQELAQFREELKAAAGDNNKRARAIEKSSKIVSKLLKLAKLAV